jgi:ABC-type glutathione transport system ATPase component
VPILSTDNLSLKNGGAVSLKLDAGERVALLGARGAGKTMLLRTLALIQRPVSGRILFEDQDITRWPDHKVRALRRRLQFVGGDPARTVAPHFTVREALSEPLLIHRLGSSDERRGRVEHMAGLFNLHPGLLNRKVAALSAAVRQRVALARAWALQPRLLLGDELTEHLEPAAGVRLLELLSPLCRAENVAWLWSTSDPALAHRFADRVLRLENGALTPPP